MIENIPIIKSIIDLILAIWKAIGGIFGKTQKSGLEVEIPKKTIIIPPNPNTHATWWHMGSYAGKPAMQIVGQSIKVTNITKYGIYLCAVKMKKPRCLGHVLVKDSNSQYHGFYEIPPGGISEISFHFWIMPPVKEAGMALKTDVAIIDQFGNEHWVKGVEFIYT